MEIRELLIGCLAVIAVMFSTGCGSTVGWEMKVGVNPINRIDDRKELKPRSFAELQSQRREKY